MTALRGRVVDLVTGQTLIEQVLDTIELVDAQAEVAADLARACGHDHALEMMDPDGDVIPAGEWVRFVVVVDGVATMVRGVL